MGYNAGMKATDVINHFGSRSGVAKALNIGRAAVWKWEHEYGGMVPPHRAAQIQELTGGKLRLDIRKYSSWYTGKGKLLPSP